MSEEPPQVDMAYVLAWHPYSRSNDLLEAFGQFAKELEVVARSRGGIAAVDLFSGKGISSGIHIVKTILQSVVFSVTDIYDLCLEQADKIEKICQISEYDTIATVKGYEQGERVTLHFGNVPELFDSLCEYLCCGILKRVVEIWTAANYVKAAKKICDGDINASVSPEKKTKILRYIATELSEPPLVIDDELLEWISESSSESNDILKEKLEEFRKLSCHRVSDFIFMIQWSMFYTNLYNDILVISEIVYASFGSSSRWDNSPLILPIIMMSSSAVSLQRTIMNIFSKTLPENSPRMRAHKRLMLKLFPS